MTKSVDSAKFLGIAMPVLVCEPVRIFFVWVSMCLLILLLIKIIEKNRFFAP